MDVGTLWVGVGFETGGEIVVGAGQQQGALLCYGDALRTPRLTRYCTIEQQSLTLGAGLGGSGGLTFLVGLNASDPQSFGQPVDWSIDFSLDMGIGGLAKYIRTIPEAVELAAIGAKFNKTGLGIAEALTKYEKNRRLVKDVADGLIKNHGSLLDTLGSKAGIISLPMPLSNYGMRLSLKTKWEGTIVTSWGSFSFLLT